VVTSTRGSWTGHHGWLFAAFSASLAGLASALMGALGTHFQSKDKINLFSQNIQQFPRVRAVFTLDLSDIEGIYNAFRQCQQILMLVINSMDGYNSESHCICECISGILRYNMWLLLSKTKLQPWKKLVMKHQPKRY